jgi:hypothetical protein
VHFTLEICLARGIICGNKPVKHGNGERKSQKRGVSDLATTRHISHASYSNLGLVLHRAWRLEHQLQSSLEMAARRTKSTKCGINDASNSIHPRDDSDENKYAWFHRIQDSFHC